MQDKDFGLKVSWYVRQKVPAIYRLVGPVKKINKTNEQKKATKEQNSNGGIMCRDIVGYGLHIFYLACR